MAVILQRGSPSNFPWFPPSVLFIKGVRNLAGRSQYVNIGPVSFSRIKEVLDLPNLLKFKQIHLKISGILFERSLRGRFLFQTLLDTMEFKFVGYEIRSLKYTLEEAHPRRITQRQLDLPSSTRKLVTKTQEVFFGDFLAMTEMSFHHQWWWADSRIPVARLQGFTSTIRLDNGKVGYGSTVIPNRGAWLELEKHLKRHCLYRIDRTRKIPFTTLVRNWFRRWWDLTSLWQRLCAQHHRKRYSQEPNGLRTDEALKEIYERLRPGEPKTAESSRASLVASFLYPHRYDLAAVGR